MVLVACFPIISWSVDDSVWENSWVCFCYSDTVSDAVFMYQYFCWKCDSCKQLHFVNTIKFSVWCLYLNILVVLELTIQIVSVFQVEYLPTLAWRQGFSCSAVHGQFNSVYLYQANHNKNHLEALYTVMLRPHIINGLRIYRLDNKKV